PSGDQIAPSAPVEIEVTWCGFPTSAPLPESQSHIQICVGSVAFDVQISRLPSGEKRGRSSWFGVGLSRRDSPPCAGTIHKCEIFVFASRSTSSASNTTHFPSGDGTGAPTRLSFIMSSKVNGCLPLERAGACVCARSELVSTRLTATKTFISGNGLAEFAHMQRVAYASPFWTDHRLPACSCRQPCLQQARETLPNSVRGISASCRDEKAGSLCSSEFSARAAGSQLFARSTCE